MTCCIWYSVYENCLSCDDGQARKHEKGTGMKPGILSNMCYQVVKSGCCCTDLCYRS